MLGTSPHISYNLTRCPHHPGPYRRIKDDHPPFLHMILGIACALCGQSYESVINKRNIVISFSSIGDTLPLR